MALFRPVTTPEYVRVGFFIVAGWGVILAVSVMLFKLNLWWGLFLSGCLLAAAPATFLFHNGEWIINTNTIIALVAVLLGCVWYLFLRQQNPRIEWVLNALCVIGIVNAVFVIAQWSSGNPNFPRVGLMSNQNETAALLAFTFPAFFRKYWRCGLAAIIPALVGASVFGGVAAAGAAFSVFMFFHGKRFIGVLVPVLGCFAYLLIDAPGLHGRTENYQLAWEVWKISPLWGIGLGQWKTLILQNGIKVYGLHPTTVHNEWVQLFVEAPIAAIAVVGWLVEKARRSVTFGFGLDPVSSDYAIPMAGLAAVFVSSMVTFPFHIATTAFLAVTWLAVIDLH